MEEWTVCRLCLESSEHALKSFPDEMYESIPFYNIYFEIVGITLVDYDAFPNKICLACEEELIRAYKFRQKCLETEEKLRDLPERGLRDEKIEFVTPVEQASSSTDLRSAKALESFSKYLVKTEKAAETPKSTGGTKESAGEKIRCKNCRIVFVGIAAFYDHKCYDIAQVVAPVEEPREGESTPKPEARRLFKCNECGQTFKMRSSILSHIEKHNKSKKYQCQYCKRRFYKASIRKAHIYRFHLRRTLEFKCPQCTNEYSKSSQLKQHIKEAHKEDITFQCDRCGKNFKSCSILTSHMKIHSDKVTCAQCGKELKNLRTLERHMEIHSGQKNYICPVCSRSFTCNFSVKNHVRKIHPDDIHLLPPDGTVVNRRYLDRMAASHRRREVKSDEPMNDSDPCTSEAINSII